MKQFIINSNDAGQRLDKFITKSTGSIPGSLIYKYLREKRIKVNRKKKEASYRLIEGDIVEMYIPDEFFCEKEELFRYIVPSLEVVYEDENILLASKAPGMSCQPDSDQKEGTLIDHVKAYLYKKGDYDPDAEASFAPALCNRIDRNTAGLVICAKNAASLRTVNAMIKDRRIRKRYLALVHGRLPEKHATLKHFLKKNSAENMVRVYTSPQKGALTALTEYEVLRYDKTRDISLIEVELHTGRTHQIRAQMSFIGNPLVGDGKYGVNREDRKAGFSYQALFSHSVEFLFPDGDSSQPLYYLKNRVFEAKPDSRFDIG